MDLSFDVYVDGARGVVKHEDRRIDEQRPRDGDPLALAPREGVAPLADDSVVAVRKVGDEPMGVGGGRCCDDLVPRCTWSAVGDVLADRGREEEWLVEDDANLRSE